ncbi:hypothetical protein [Demequina aurantiaca]|uniref:hypothetical protein n=1 Tax=Demequina aurantiaca TaxID=676200 RepID=UPI003D33DE61
MSRNLSPVNLNTHALTEQVDKASRDAWIETVKNKPEYLKGRVWPRVILGVMMALLVLPILAFVVVMIAAAFSGEIFVDGISPVGAAGLGVGLLIVGGLLFSITFGVTSFVKSFTQWTQWYRLLTFAQTNGFEFVVTTDPSSMPGTIASGGHKVTRDNYFVVPTEPTFEYGTVTRHTKSQQVAGGQSWAFIEFRTATALPNMMLEVKGSDTRNYTFWDSQKVELADQFAKRFTLYAADGAHDAALQMFPPDLLRLIDETDHGFNIEVIHDRIVLHSSVPFNLQKPKEHERVMRIANTVGRSLLESAASMAGDDRGVTVEGDPRRKRLRSRYTVGGAVVGLILLASPYVLVTLWALTKS